MRLLVAGLTGQLGAGLLDVVGEGGAEVVPVVRPRSSGSPRRWPDPRLASAAVTGDVRAPLWALGNDVLADLAVRVDAVVNLAGETNWAGSSLDLFTTNVLGAAHGLELARELQHRSGRPVPYIYASSVFVAGGMLGSVPEQLLPAGGTRTGYEQSKWLAERRVVDSHGEVPLLVARVCALVGDSRTGRTSRRNSLYLLADRIDDLPHGLLPVMEGARVDALPRDEAARLLLRAVRAMCERSSSRHLPAEPVICHLGTGATAPTLASLLAAARAADPMRFRCPPRTVVLSARPLLWATANLDRFLPVDPAWHNTLIGWRYVGLDRVFERDRLSSLVGDPLPTGDAHQLARLVFGPAPAAVHAGSGTTTARFPG